VAVPTIAVAPRASEQYQRLSAEQLRYWLHELWILDVARLPARGLPKLGGIWPYAAPWLAQVPVLERPEALRLLETFSRTEPAQPQLFAALARTPGDTAALLAVRGHLLRGEVAPALEQVDAMLASLRKGSALSLSAYSVESEMSPDPAPRASEELEGEEEAPAREVRNNQQRDPLVDRLNTWLMPFREAKHAQPVEARFCKLLKQRRDEGSISLEAWRLAFQLTPEPGRAALARARWAKVKAAGKSSL